MNNIFFSVIIPTYNRAHTLPRCINSLLSQTYTNWEALVIDNYSVDETDTIISKYGDKRIRLIKNANNGVIANSRNVGINISQGDWLCFLDSDDFWMPNKLESIIKYTNEYNWIYHNYKPDINSFFSSRYVVRGLDFKKKPLEIFLKNGNIMATSSVCISRKIIGDSRFPESNLYIGVEDYLFWLQLCENNPNVRIKHLKSVLSVYGIGDNFSSSSNQYTKEQRIYYLYKDKVSTKLRKDILRWLLYRKASYLFQSKKYKLARKYYYIVLKSSSSRLAFNSFKAILKSLYLK